MRVLQILVAMLATAMLFAVSVPTARGDGTFNVFLTTVPSGVVSLGTPVQAVVVVTDAQGQPAPGMNVVVEGSPLWWWGIPCTTDSAGQCSVNLDSPTTEQVVNFGSNGFWVDAWVDVNSDGLFEDEPTTGYSLIVWQPDVQAVSLTASSNVCEVDSCSVNLTATTLDGSGNPVPGASVAWQGSSLAAGVTNSLGQFTTTQYPLTLPTSLSIRACFDRNASQTVDAGENICSGAISIDVTLPSTRGVVTVRGVGSGGSQPGAFTLQLYAVSDGNHLNGSCLYLEHNPQHQIRCDSITALARMSDTHTIVIGTGVLDKKPCRFRFDFFLGANPNVSLFAVPGTGGNPYFLSFGFMNGHSGQITIAP